MKKEARLARGNQLAVSKPLSMALGLVKGEGEEAQVVLTQALQYPS